MKDDKGWFRLSVRLDTTKKLWWQPAVSSHPCCFSIIFFDGGHEHHDIINLNSNLSRVALAVTDNKLSVSLTKHARKLRKTTETHHPDIHTVHCT